MLFISGAVQDGYDLKLNVMTMVMRRAIGSPICSLLSWHIVHIVYISVYITSMSLPGTLWNGLNMTASFLCVQDIINDTPPIYAKCTFIVPHYWFAIWPLLCVCFAFLCVPRCIIIVVISYYGFKNVFSVWNMLFMHISLSRRVLSRSHLRDASMLD